MKKLQEAPIHTSTNVLVRCDLDVPLENGAPKETFRLESCISTLKYIQEKGGYPIICGHIGKPKGTPDPALSTRQLRSYFEDQLKTTHFELLENLRFDSREEQNDLEYAKELAAKADLFVNESFATCHRQHASIVGIPKILPSYAGLHLQEEIDTLTKVLSNPKRPLVTVVGGAKIESKRPVIEKFLQIADQVLVGGRVGMDWHAQPSEKLQLPQDYVTDKDIGPETCEEFVTEIGKARTIIWAGPMGAFEDKQHEEGTRRIAEAIAQATQGGAAFSVVGGGDTINAANKFGLLKNFSFVSTGGSAMLQFLVGGTLPGIEVLA